MVNYSLPFILNSLSDKTKKEIISKKTKQVPNSILCIVYKELKSRQNTWICYVKKIVGLNDETVNERKYMYVNA